MAIAQTHTSEAVQVLRSAFETVGDPWFRAALLSAVALTRQAEATEWLLEQVSEEESWAEDALAALCRSAPSEETLARLRELGKGCK